MTNKTEYQTIQRESKLERRDRGRGIEFIQGHDGSYWVKVVDGKTEILGVRKFQ